jgi:hypothetical protein
MKILKFALIFCLVLSLWQAVNPMTVSHNLKTNYSVVVTDGRSILPSVTTTKLSSVVAFSYVCVLREACVGKSVHQTFVITDYG